MRLANPPVVYPTDAWLVTINADDRDFCHAGKEGIVAVLGAGVARSVCM